MTRRENLIGLAILFLALAGLVIWWQAGTGQKAPDGDRGHAAPERLEGSGGTKASGAASDREANDDTRPKPPSPVVEISGLGTLPYAKVEKNNDLNEILLRCGLIAEGDYESRMRRGSKAKASIYTNEKGEIVHICFQKGLYKTKSRDLEAMAHLGRTDMPGSGGLSIVEFGVPGLVLDSTEMLRPLLSRFTGTYDERLEVEVTPVIVEVTGGFRGDPKYVGRRFPMLLEKRASGPPTSEEVVQELVYDWRTELICRKWFLNPFLPDPEAEDGLQPKVGNSGIFNEPLLEAWERVQAEKADQVKEGARD